MASVRAIRCGTLFDGTGGAPVRSALVVDRARIAAAGPAASVPVPVGAEVLDWSDRFVMPGFAPAGGRRPAASRAMSARWFPASAPI